MNFKIIFRCSKMSRIYHIFLLKYAFNLKIIITFRLRKWYSRKCRFGKMYSGKCKFGEKKFGKMTGFQSSNILVSSYTKVWRKRLKQFKKVDLKLELNSSIKWVPKIKYLRKIVIFTIFFKFVMITVLPVPICSFLANIDTLPFHPFY